MQSTCLLQCATKRKGVGAAGEQLDQDNIDVRNPMQWMECLLPEQVNRLRLYRDLAPRRCYSLQQAPGGDDGASRGLGAHSDEKGHLHTVIKNCVPLWADALPTPRLCHPYEIAGAQSLFVFEGERRA